MKRSSSSIDGSSSREATPREGGVASEALHRVLRTEIDGNHESVGAFVLERVVAGTVRLDRVRHEDESVVARCAPITKVLDDHRIAGHPLRCLQAHFGDLAA